MKKSNFAKGLGVLTASAMLISGFGNGLGTVSSAAQRHVTRQSSRITYQKPTPLDHGSQASFQHLLWKAGQPIRVAYMPPATEFNYYLAIGQGIKDVAAQDHVQYFMLAPQSGNDINGQMGMLQDVIHQKVDVIIFNTHDEHAAAPLIKQAIAAGIVVVNVNSDIPNFPAPVHAVVGYLERRGDYQVGQYAVRLMKHKKAVVGVVAGAPGWFSTQRVDGFLDGIKGNSNFQVVSQVDGNWDVAGGNSAAMNMLQAHPNINLVFAANDYMIEGTQKAAQALGDKGIIFLGSDGDPSAFEAIAANQIQATLNTSPYEMGKIALQVALDSLHGKFHGGFVQTPVQLVDKSNVIGILRHPEQLYPKPRKKY